MRARSSSREPLNGNIHQSPVGFASTVLRDRFTLFRGFSASILHTHTHGPFKIPKDAFQRDHALRRPLRPFLKVRHLSEIRSSGLTYSP